MGFLIFGLQWRFEDDFKDLEIIEGKIIYYNFYYSGRKSKSLNGVIHLDTYKKDSKTWTKGDKHFDFMHLDSFKKLNFELAGGGLGSKVKLGVKPESLSDDEHSAVIIHRLIYKDKDYIDIEEFQKLDKKNNKYFLIFSGILMLFGLADLFPKRK